MRKPCVHWWQIESPAKGDPAWWPAHCKYCKRKAKPGQFPVNAEVKVERRNMPKLNLDTPKFPYVEYRA